MSIRFITDLHTHLRKTRTIRDVPPMPGKSYPRFEQLELPQTKPIIVPLSETLAKRRSCSAAMTGDTLSLQHVSDILGHSLAVRADKHRPHPSGGARYLLETYILAFAVEGLQRASFHYNPQKHVLEHLWDLADEHVPSMFFQDSLGYCKNASALIILTAMWERSFERYSSWSFELGFYEAGHVGQNILLTATALGLASRPYGGYKEETIATLLDLDQKREQTVYAIALGN